MLVLEDLYVIGRYVTFPHLATLSNFSPSKNNRRTNKDKDNKRQYCVIVYVGHFWPPKFGPISVRYLLYMPTSLILNTIYFLCVPLLVLSLHGLVEHVRGARMRGGGGITRVVENCSRMWARSKKIINMSKKRGVKNNQEQLFRHILLLILEDYNRNSTKERVVNTWQIH